MLLRPLASPLAGAVAGGSTAKSRIHAARFPIAIDSPPRARAAAVHKTNPCDIRNDTAPRMRSPDLPPGLARAFGPIRVARSAEANRLSPHLKSPLKSFDHAACVHILGPARS